MALVLPGDSVSAEWEQPVSSSAPVSAAAGSAARDGRIGFDIVQSSLFGAKALPGVRGRSSTGCAEALPSG
ncbi:hypothetical protein HEK616_61550 [Streptomyces nigrescens]|uniref:Uncharacterized protein n=1 Tax=Streptomyces nigrescens TaxID=1920 RepID=A0ABM8A202_STRNI|nr:hypothetical protein HEK616_61550 [Streptomyces nigrescens]